MKRESIIREILSGQERLQEIENHLQSTSGYVRSDFERDILDPNNPLSQYNYERGILHGLRLCLSKDMSEPVHIERSLKITQLKLMHDLVSTANDEEIYFDWIQLMPDEPLEYDFGIAAEDDSYYHELCVKFLQLVKQRNFFY